MINKFKNISLFFTILFFIIGIFIPSQVSCTNYYLISDLGTSARMIGLAGIEGFSMSSNAIFENPAGLYRTNNASVSLFSTTLMTELYYNNMSICANTPIGKIGIGYMEAATFDIPHTGKDAAHHNEIYEISLYDYKNSIYKISYQTSLTSDFHLGVSYVEYKNALFDVYGTGSNFDLGAIYDFAPFSFSFAVKNLIPESYVTYRDGAKENLNMHILGAVKYTISDFDLFVQVKRKERRVLISKALVYYPSFLRFINFSAGHKEFLVKYKKNNNYILGVGLNLAGINFNYAFEKSDHFEFDNKNYFSVSLNL
jgi:hypothetical protein